MEKMDLDIGNLFYIVITLVAVILGVAGKKRKQSPAPPQGSSENERPPGFMQTLENLLNMGQEELPFEEETETEIPVEEPQPEYASEKSAFMQEYERVTGRDLGFQGNRIAEVKEEDMEKLEVIDLDEKGGTNYFDIVRDFDAETAVIFSAIINRIDY